MTKKNPHKPKARRTTTKDRLEKVALVLGVSEKSTPAIQSLGRRLLSKELADIERQTRQLELYELERFHTLGPPGGDRA